MCHFYKMSYTDLVNMSAPMFETLWLCITPIEAQEQLKLMSALDWPNMKPAQRKKMHRELFSKAYPSEMRPKKSITANDLQRMLSK